ncbi:hypothetical protein [Streptomyces pini]|uniref:Uncharacterized protein n=1 Tax=Streptomyces pini TaxID=1520580 RepID=A0A1I4BW80_9ACTN|nr:hypothetical protein [Streptomyces pini]SFK72803.1 hypothetical protein SAMN05192584_108157 [Streptomyces pini]
MAEIGYAQLPVPAGGDAPVGPAAFAALASGIDPHLIQHVADQAQRDADFGDAPLHTAVSAEDGSLWLKTSATSNTWATVYEPDPAWRPLSLVAGLSSGTVPPGIRRIGNRVHVRGAVEKTDGALIVGSPAIKLGDVPEDCRPRYTGRGAGGQTISGDPIVGVGRIEVLGEGWEVNDGTWGSIMWYSQDGSGSSWVGLDFSYWID